MKTITFYSYKGGVGRSLALSNMATRLSELGQKVCVIDFDLDAPGLRFKFKKYKFSSKIEKGLVDYIYKFSREGKIDNIEDYCVKLTPPNESFEQITFICAGEIERSLYWKKLTMIDWYDLFYSDQPQGIKFFIDMKAQISKKIAPDYLLIDSRTGITDISGITLRVLADQVVILSIDNDENRFGSKKIIKSLLKIESSLFNKIPIINFVLTRVPFNELEKEKENKVIEKIKSEFKDYLNSDNFDVSVIHSERKIEMEESNLFDLDSESQLGPISKDYLNLFEKVTKDTLNLDEQFMLVKKAEIEYVKFLNEKVNVNKLNLIEKAISFDNTKYIYFAERGILHYKMGNVEEALQDHVKALQLNPENAQLNYNIASFFKIRKDYLTALKYLDKVTDLGYKPHYLKGYIFRKLNRLPEALNQLNIAVEIDPSQDNVLNGRADVHRLLSKFQEAIADITQAIQLNPNKPIYFATLAEIYSSMDQTDEFFINLSFALSKGLDVSELNSAKDVYKKYFEDERFLNLLLRYKIDIADVINNMDEN